MDIWLFVLGYIIHLLGSGLLLYKIKSQQSIYGLSIDTQVCFLVATVSRVIWTMETRLIDTYLAYLELFGACLASGYIVYLSFFKYYYSTTEHAQWYLRAPVLSAAAMVLAFFFNPSTDWWSTQILVAFTMYLEGLALVPQLWLMQRMDDIEPLTSHYVAMLIAARAVRMIFWVVLFMKGDKFIQLFVGDFMHTLFALDYAYLYAKRIRQGGRLAFKMDRF